MRNLILLAALGFAVLPSTKAAVLRGTITDAGGAAINGAFILAFDDQVQVKASTPFPGETVVASEKGAFELKLNVGFYDVCVFSSGFAPNCKKLQVQKDRGDLLYDVKLGVDPLIVKERGDRFSAR